MHFCLLGSVGDIAREMELMNNRVRSTTTIIPDIKRNSTMKMSSLVDDLTLPNTPVASSSSENVAEQPTQSLSKLEHRNDSVTDDCERLNVEIEETGVVCKH